MHCRVAGPIAAIGLLFGCSGELVLPELPSSPEAKTQVLVIGDGSQALTHHAIDLSAPRAFRFDLPERATRIEAFLFDATPDELGIQVGQDTLDEGSSPARDTVEAYGLSLDDRSWVAVESPTWLDTIKLPGENPLACIVEGGCFVQETCTTPCPTPSAIEAPAPSSLPEMTCRPGWRTLARDAVVGCQPWADDPFVCGAGEIALPGGCRRLGEACPNGSFPTPTPGRTILHVEMGATNGDGTLQAPYGAIDVAFAAAPAGARVVVGAGTWDVADLEVPAGVELAGVCVERTIFDGPIEANAGVHLDSFTTTGRLILTGANVTVRGVSATTLVAHAEASLDDVELVGASRSVVFDARADTVVAVTGLSIHGPSTKAIVVRSNARADFQDTLIGGAMQFGVDARTATVSLRGFALVGPRGIYLERSTVDIEDLFVADTVEGAGLDAWSSAVNATRVTTTRNEKASFIARGGGSTFHLEDYVSIDNMGRSIRFNQIEDATLERLAVAGRQDAVMRVERSDVEASDITVRGPDGAADAPAAVVVDRGSLTGGRFDIRDTNGSGFVFNVGEVQLTDVSVERAGLGRCFGAAGFRAWGESNVDMTRVRLAALRGGAVSVNNSMVRLFDLLVSGVTSTGQCGLEDHLENEGDGIWIQSGELTVEGFVVEDAVNAGVRISARAVDPTSARLSDGVVTGCKYGLEVELEDRDYAAWSQGVDYTNNETAVEESFAGGAP